MRADREVRRELFRITIPAAHAGLALFLLADGCLAFFAGSTPALIATAACAALFLTSLAVALARGRRGTRALRTAYKATFGWVHWL